MRKKGWIRSGDIVMISWLDRDHPKEYGLVIRSLSTHYDERYRMWAVLVGGRVKNVAESWIVALESK